MLSNLSREARAEKKARKIAKAKVEVTSHEQSKEECDEEEAEEGEKSEKEEKVGEADEEEDEKGETEEEGGEDDCGKGWRARSSNNRSRDMYRSMEGSALMVIGAPYILCRSVQY
jgi:hypothetical protein